MNLRGMNTTAARVSDYMTAHPHSIGLHEPLREAYALMRRHNVRHLPVLVGGKLVGLVADPDLRTIDLLERIDLARLSVEEAMTPMPFSVTADARLDMVVKQMVASRHDAVVVMRDAEVVGVFTASDALRALADALSGAAKRQP
jgi:acetoin utilization protein AcuB